MENKDIENNQIIEETPIEPKIYPPHSVRIYPKPFYDENAEVKTEEPPAYIPERPHTKAQAKIDALQNKLNEERARLNANLDLKQAKIDALQVKEDQKNAKRAAKKK